MQEFIGCFKKYAVFAGRARRREYWMFTLFNILVSFVLGIVVGFVAGMSKSPELVWLGQIYTLAVFLPGLAVSVRRLHDTGRSGWWFLVNLVPIVGLIVMLVFLCLDSQPGANQYGPNPKGL